MLVYAVYAKSKNKLYRRDIICKSFVKKCLHFPFVFSSIVRRSTLGRRLLLARTLPSEMANLLHLGKTKEQVSLLCPRFFVTLALPKLPALGNEKKN
jgi:hypothetical protein